jgi:negative regulator of flagellin synthesis FlgM
MRYRHSQHSRRVEVAFWNAGTRAVHNDPAKSGSMTGGSALSSDQATFSGAGSEVSQTADDDDTEVRMDKVAAIQAALAAGTYNVSASDVASKVVDSMLDGQS